MKPITDITDQFDSLYMAAECTGKQYTNLKRWINKGALVDADGNIWTKSGATILIKSRRKKKVTGRKKMFTPEDDELILQLRESGMLIKVIAYKFEVTEPTISNAITRAKKARQ